MSHQREPIPHTCPQIDKWISSIKREVRKDRDIEDATHEKLVPITLDINNELERCLGYFEEIRKSNDTLRNWGEMEAVDCDRLENEIESERQAHLQTKKELEELQDAISTKYRLPIKGATGSDIYRARHDADLIAVFSEQDDLLIKNIQASRQRNKS